MLRKKKPCLECGKKTEFTKGLCKNCYLQKWLKKRSDDSPLIECECGCNELIPSINKRGEKARFKTHHNNKFGIGSPHWKGGRSSINNNTYTTIYSPTHPFRNCQNYVRFHRYSKEIYLSILNGIPTYIHPGLHVHHKDENPKNNNLSNLEITEKKPHLQYHYSKRKINELGQFI